MCVEDVGLMAVFSFHPAVQHPAETYSSSVFKFWESKIVHYSVLQHLARQCFACDALCAMHVFLKGWIADLIVICCTRHRQRSTHMLSQRERS